MNTLIRLFLLVGIFALWGQAQAYEVVIDLNVKQVSMLQKTTAGNYELTQTPHLSGHAWIEIDGQRHNFDLSQLHLSAPTSKDTDGSEWAYEWLGEAAPELIMDMRSGFDPDLMQTEVDLRRQKMRCRGDENLQCNGELSVRLSVSRS